MRLRRETRILAAPYSCSRPVSTARESPIQRPHRPFDQRGVFFAVGCDSAVDSLPSSRMHPLSSFSAAFSSALFWFRSLTEFSQRESYIKKTRTFQMVDLGLLGSSPSSHGTQRVCPTGEGGRQPSVHGSSRFRKLAGSCAIPSVVGKSTPPW